MHTCTYIDMCIHIKSLTYLYIHSNIRKHTYITLENFSQTYITVIVLLIFSYSMVSITVDTLISMIMQYKKLKILRPT